MEQDSVHEYSRPGRGPGPQDLKPGHTYILHFRNLPETLHGVAARYPAHATDLRGAGRNADTGPAASFYLPENYSRRRKTPLLLFLQGGDGGPGMNISADDREMADATGCVFVNVPLFKAPLKSPPRFSHDLFVHARDHSTMLAVYKKMLSAVCRVVPHVDGKRGVLGGFSHGAQATAILLGFADRFILDHFHSFMIVDGGYTSFLALMNPMDLKNRNILLLVGEEGDYAARPRFLASTQWIEEIGRDWDIHVRRVVMKRTSHAFPRRYRRVAINWINAVNSRKHGDESPC